MGTNRRKGRLGRFQARRIAKTPPAVETTKKPLTDPPHESGLSAGLWGFVGPDREEDLLHSSHTGELTEATSLGPVLRSEEEGVGRRVRIDLQPDDAGSGDQASPAGSRPVGSLRNAGG